MSERYTEKMARNAFARLAHRLGKPWTDERGFVRYGPPHDPGPSVGMLWTDGRARVGAWLLDNGAAGLGVHEIMNEGGGVTLPLGYRGMTPREFCQSVRFALDALDAKERP